ncbi:hypothetical protein N431DRAFT_468297 [Stipitochalara longipes BDJ]|nr:hypothetical protein N431DRAFT_468297 [Stipitochalara longipes BDJ]
MVELSDITYSREESIAAVRNFYHLLTQLYMKESNVIEPPHGGWPSITSETMKGVGKSDEVVALLRNLPYIRRPDDPRYQAEGVPGMDFVDWQADCRDIAIGTANPENCKSFSEDVAISEDVPSTVIGLTYGGLWNSVYLLDTKYGIVHWRDCPFQVWSHYAEDLVVDDWEEYVPENELEWREECKTWSIVKFFEILKDQYLKLHYIPINPRKVLIEDTESDPDDMLSMLQAVYREHGWPDLDRYHKEECLKAVQKELNEHYPDYASDRGDE